MENKKDSPAQGYDSMELLSLFLSRHEFLAIVNILNLG